MLAQSVCEHRSKHTKEISRRILWLEEEDLKNEYPQWSKSSLDPWDNLIGRVLKGSAVSAPSGSNKDRGGVVTNEAVIEVHDKSDMERASPTSPSTTDEKPWGVLS
jgi:hypothetical protein